MSPLHQERMWGQASSSANGSPTPLGIRVNAVTVAVPAFSWCSPGVACVGWIVPVLRWSARETICRVGPRTMPLFSAARYYSGATTLSCLLLWGLMVLAAITWVWRTQHTRFVYHTLTSELFLVCSGCRHGREGGGPDGAHKRAWRNARNPAKDL